MFTASNFYQLSYQQQADVLLANATFLLSRIEDSFIVDLYELDDLLIEIFYEMDNEELVSVMAYNTQEKLKALTRGVNLTPRLTIRKEGATYQPQHEFFA